MYFTEMYTVQLINHLIFNIYTFLNICQFVSLRASVITKWLDIWFDLLQCCIPHCVYFVVK